MSNGDGQFESRPDNLDMDAFMSGGRAFREEKPRHPPKVLTGAMMRMSWMSDRPMDDDMKKSWLHGYDCAFKQAEMKASRDSLQRAFGRR